jgi:hypothetical protein
MNRRVPAAACTDLHVIGKKRHEAKPISTGGR